MYVIPLNFVGSEQALAPVRLPEGEAELQNPPNIAPVC